MYLEIALFFLLLLVYAIIRDRKPRNMPSGRRYDLRSKDFDSVYQAVKEFQEQSAYVFLPALVPALKYIPKTLRNIIFKEDVFDKFVSTSCRIVSEAVKEHEAELDPDIPRDMIDESPKSVKEEKKGKEAFFWKRALLQIVNDMFFAGSDTVNNMLRWTASLLARHPNAAAKLHQEIDREVGSNRIVSLDDKH